MSPYSAERLKEHHDIAWLYSGDLQIIRGATCAIVSEIYKMENECLGIALLLTLESTGHIFFEKVVTLTKKFGGDQDLLYFSSFHLDVEMAHALFEQERERNYSEKCCRLIYENKH
jgi:hypothetical protein